MPYKIIGTTSSEYENVQVKEEGPEMEPEEGIEVLQQEATLHTTNIKVEPVYDSFDNSPWDSGSIGVSIKHDFDEGCPEKIYPKVEPETVEEFLNAEDVIHKYETHEKEVEEDANLQREATNLHKFVEIEIEQVYNNIPGDNGSMCVSMKQNVDQGDPANEEPELTDIEDNEFVSAVRENVDSGTYCQQEIKGPLKKHQCGICGKVLANRGSYTKHTRKHISKAPFQCEVCLRSFTERGSLVTHKRSHTGEKPYKCNTCPMAFPRLETLKVHIRTHTGETPFTCHVCQKSFTLERNLKKHIIKHSSEKPFKCDICHRRFTEYRALKVHVRLHTGEKPYKCDTCQSTFQRCEQLREHIRTHTGDNRYQCKICLTIFTQLCKLKRHMNRLRGCQAPS